MKFKCENCKREVETPLNIVMYMCGCGHTTELKKEEDKHGLHRE